MADFVIRSATAADLPAVRELFVEYQRAIGVDLCFQGFTQELTSLPGAYAPPDGRLLLAEAGGSLVGCAALKRSSATHGELKRLYVRPGHEGHGLGRRLAEAIIGEARGAGYAALRLDTLPTMTRAHALYRALGFEQITAWAGEPVAGMLFFELRL